MPTTDHDGLGPDLEGRLKNALDRIAPPYSSPRYQAAALASTGWRIAPIALAVAAVCLLALTAIAATGSASPVVWTQRAASTIQSIGHQPEVTPSPASNAGTTPVKSPPEYGTGSPEPERGGGASSPTPDREHEGSPAPESGGGAEQSSSAASTGSSNEPRDGADSSGTS